MSTSVGYLAVRGWSGVSPATPALRYTARPLDGKTLLDNDENTPHTLATAQQVAIKKHRKKQ
ncbi:MAG: hypothetical protein ACLFUS_12420, partial [Candidatus Sumerlaeia bacterium]